MKPPASFLQAMEEYVREAPRGSTFRKDQVRIFLCMHVLVSICVSACVHVMIHMNIKSHRLLAE